ncbi:hypothetical protein SAY86_003803 [Trapa natans]|uniref:Rapid alkalinization factor n=1 Tax=Trapa natans TaxID=22666 RepID=A0AAN7RN56_TRANT|nr:hypothetical protein SAY86_003803 [Trapa natans]
MSRSATITCLAPLALLFILLSDVALCSGFSVMDSESIQLDEPSVLGNAAQDVCSGRIEECLKGSPELESDSSRRVLLMQKRYISYETLKRDVVPCMRPGASYYNCNAGQANPYTRGCEMIAGCRS